jgi:hypothetical protein
MEHTWEKYKAILTGVRNTLLKRKAIEELANDRLNICSTCPDQTKDCAPMISTCCALCGCSLAWKTRVPEQGCPAGKWPSLNMEK